MAMKRMEQAGMGRIELLVILAVIGLLAILGWKMTGKVQKTVTADACMSNLKLLGAGFAVYAENYEGKLPYAYIKRSSREYYAWDSLVYPFVRISQQKGGEETAAAAAIAHGPLVKCPQDRIPGYTPAGAKKAKERRTYAMPRHGMNEWHWPPGGTNRSGLGLYWSDTGKNYAGLDWLNANTNPPAFYTSMIRKPEATLLLTEQAQTNNIVKHHTGAAIRYTADHLDTNLMSMAEYHGGRFNYLMVDGHVELLEPGQTVGKRGKAGADSGTHNGIWTVRPAD